MTLATIEFDLYNLCFPDILLASHPYAEKLVSQCPVVVAQATQNVARRERTGGKYAYSFFTRNFDTSQSKLRS